MSDLVQATDPVRYAGHLTEEEWVEGGRLAHRGLKYTSNRQAYLYLSGLILGCILIFVFRDMRFTAGFAFLWLAYVAVTRSRIKRVVVGHLDGLRRQYEQPAFSAPFESSWDAAGFHTWSTAFDHVRSWKDFRTWREDEMYLVVFEPGCYRVIPKRMLGDGTETLRAMFRKHIGKAI